MWDVESLSIQQHADSANTKQLAITLKEWSENRETSIIVVDFFFCE